MAFIVQRRRCIEVNTDPQRRCYYGCHAKSEMVWTGWTDLSSADTREKAESQMKYWRELNDYAVSQRGEGARQEFQIREGEFT